MLTKKFKLKTKTAIFVDVILIDYIHNLDF